MAYIKLEIDVHNPDEVITNHKGQLAGMASLLLTTKKKKAIVQQKIYDQVIEELKTKLDEKLLAEGVKGNVSITIES